MKKERIIRPKNLHPQDPKTTPKDRTDPHKLRREIVPKTPRTVTRALKNEHIMRMMRIKKISSQGSINHSKPPIMNFTMITMQFSQYQHEAKQIAKDFPQETASVAQCWAFFITSFGTQHQGLRQSLACQIL